MITIRTNIGSVTAGIVDKLALLKDKERIVRSCAVQMSGEIRRRIHVDGQDASGNPIGTYSSKYLKLRQKKYNRTSDSNVILSLTSQQENDMGAIETPRGYGIGFKNPLNLKKAAWAEERYGGTDTQNKIYAFTQNESKSVGLIIQDEYKKIVDA